MRQRCEFDDVRGIDRALRTSIAGLSAEYVDELGADRLTATCLKAKIFLPTEGDFQVVMEKPLVEAFARAGCDQVILGDEFGEHDIPAALDFLRSDEPWNSHPDWPQIYRVRRIYDARRSMIAIVPWDHFFTVIAMTSECAARVRIDELLEGFWCGEETTQGWFTDPPLPMLGP